MNFNKDEKIIILIVDDIPNSLKNICDFLKDYGFQVLVAEDGESAIKIAEYVLPDLILLDVILPRIDGFKTCQILKNNPATQDIPVIILSNPTDKISTIKVLNTGAVDYITKPLENQEVLARVNIHLRLRNLTKKLTDQNIDISKQQAALRECKHAEQQIREQAALLNITTDAILVQDLSNQIQFWNKGAEHLYGWTAQEALGKNSNQLLYRKQNFCQLKNIQKTLAESGSWQGELHQVTKQGQEIIVASRWTLINDEEGQAKSILIVNSDITEKKQLEAQFLRAQRMESLGILASGIAHDLNNALTPIMMTMQLLEAKLPDEKSHQWLGIMETNVKRVADLVKQVLWFSRGSVGNFKTLQVRNLVSEIENIIKQTFSRAIEIRIDVPTQNLWNIFGDGTQLHQVLMNLCINARDAMPTGGILKISAKNFWVDSHYARMNIDAKLGSYIMISVSDTGTGIPTEIVDRIFEPFFTTKEVGKGRGLGLSTVLGIIKSHGGFVNVVTEVTKGTEFQVCLPVTQTIETDSKLCGDSELPSGHGELILVVDDEDSIREITKTWLEQNGYKVIVANDGIDAIALYTKHQQEISALLIDMMMPHMDGPTTINVLKKINPDIKIIGISGLASNHEMIKTLGNNVKTFLSKPYTSCDLLRNLQMVLNTK
ncbi:MULTISPECIES: response regulator [Nostoc]|uniref:histidine kinase n=1 Tax=Nostoc paludosum FACHB-159 TaxID=2692908 RepID=A0ABR8KET9_9NOSO|nr:MULTISPECIES: response regulator [Nostoc]MBD2680877.1 response regulator [Nostoc sp. FACHB-857]MBD2737354.1 response regulator [Nostoc paludosum FACHB-159]